MTDKEKAQKKFAALMEKTIQAAKTNLDRKVIKIMNAVDSNGNIYNTAFEVDEAYGWDYITDDERHRLLKALNYKEDRPNLTEDYLISLCRRALHLIDDDNYAEKMEQKAKEIKSKLSEIKRNGGTALDCGCCGDVIGEVDNHGRRFEYPGYTECVRGRVCKNCLRNCRNQCKIQKQGEE